MMLQTSIIISQEGTFTLLKVDPDNEKFGVWLETQDGTRIHLNTVCMAQLMQDLEMTWLNFFSYGFDGVLEQ